MDDSELSESQIAFAHLLLLLYNSNLKIPNNIRLYLVNGDEEFYLNNGRIGRAIKEHEFKFQVKDRGSILNALAKLEFFISELIRFKISGFESEKSDLIIDLISTIGVSRQISLLAEWKIIDSELKKTLNSLIEVRNGLAHKFLVEEINYKNKQLLNPEDQKIFDEFRNDLENSWIKLAGIYAKEQDKIDFLKLADDLRKFNNLE